MLCFSTMSPPAKDSTPVTVPNLQNRGQDSEAEQGARGCWGVGVRTVTPAHVQYKLG